MKSTRHYPSNASLNSPLRAVREFGQLTPLKFAAMLWHRSEKLDKKTKCIALLIFLAISLSGSISLLLLPPAPILLPRQPTETGLHYLPDYNKKTDSLNQIYIHSQLLNSHD